MNKFLLSLFLASVSLSAYSQQISFGYDEAGNRVKREIVMTTLPNAAKRHSEFSESYSECLKGRSVNISCYPEQGKLRVTIKGLGDNEACHVRVYTTAGSLVLDQDGKTDVFDVDISNQPIGVYLLHITINDNTTTWKIVKR